MVTVIRETQTTRKRAAIERELSSLQSQFQNQLHALRIACENAIPRDGEGESSNQRVAKMMLHNTMVRMDELELVLASIKPSLWERFITWLTRICTRN